MGSRVEVRVLKLAGHIYITISSIETFRLYSVLLYCSHPVLCGFFITEDSIFPRPGADIHSYDYVPHDLMWLARMCVLCVVLMQLLVL